MRRPLAVAFLVAASALAWAGAGGAAPILKVKSFSPKAGRTRVALESRIRVKFTRPIDLASATPQTAGLRKLSGDAVAALYSTERNGKVLVLTPQGGLDPGTDFEVIVRPGLLSTDGATLRAPRTAVFFTETRISLDGLLRPDQFETLTSAMTEGRAAHSATLFGGGRVLLAGGFVDYVSHASGGDVYSPVDKSFRPAGGSLNVQRAYHPAVNVADGVMLIGGSGVNGALSSTEVYLPATSEFVVGPQMQEERDFVAATRLADGRVLVVGGLRYAAHGAVYSDTAEIYDAQAGAFRYTLGAPMLRRAGHTLTVLASGKVLIVGGQAGGSTTPVAAEIFDPVTETFTKSASQPLEHRQLHTATPIGTSGLVLLADGGSALLEMYDANSDSFFPAGGASVVNRIGATASLLPDGRVLLAGGLQDLGADATIALDGMDLWVETGGDHGSVLRANAVFPEPRYGHTATELPGHRVLFAGGFGQSDSQSLSTGIVLTPDPPK